MAFFTTLAVATWLRSRELGILMLPGFCSEALVAASFFVRREPRRTVTGWTPRWTAYANSFMVPLFVLASTAWHPLWVAPSPMAQMKAIGLLIWMIGVLLALCPLWYLRHSFSLEPAARDLVTRGPYRLSRHPIYSTYLLTYIGLWLVRPTPLFATVLLAWLALLLVRIRFEEAVLAVTFSEYAEYRRRVSALVPGLRWLG